MVEIKGVIALIEYPKGSESIGWSNEEGGGVSGKLYHWETRLK